MTLDKKATRPRTGTNNNTRQPQDDERNRSLVRKSGRGSSPEWTMPCRKQGGCRWLRVRQYYGRYVPWPAWLPSPGRHFRDTPPFIRACATAGSRHPSFAPCGPRRGTNAKNAVSFHTFKFNCLSLVCIANALPAATDSPFSFLRLAILDPRLRRKLSKRLIK